MKSDLNKAHSIAKILAGFGEKVHISDVPTDVRAYMEGLPGEALPEKRLTKNKLPERGYCHYHYPVP